MNSNTRDALIDFIDAVCNFVNTQPLDSLMLTLSDRRTLFDAAERLKDKLKGDETIP